MSILRSKHSGWTWEGRRTPFGDGGGGGQPVQQTVSQTNIPDYARPYVETMLGQTQALTDINQNPYQPYAGQQVAGFTPMQAQAFQNIAGQQTAGQIGEASDLASQVGRTALGAFGQGQQYGQQALGYGQAGSQYGAAGAALAPGAQRYGATGADIGMRGIGLGQAGVGYGAQAADMSGMGFGAGQRFERMATSPGAQAAFMSPYMQNVVDWQKDQAIRDYNINRQAEQARAVGAGAFGGSRQAVAQAEGNRALMNQLAGIQATGTQKAFEDAQKQMQFGADVGLRGLGLGYQGLQTGMQGADVGLRGLGTAMQGQELGLRGLGQAGQLYNLGMQGSALGLQGVQGAVNAGQYGLAGLGAAGQAASTLGALGQTQFGQQAAINEAMARAGQQQQALQQRGLDIDYQRYQESMNYPYKQLGFMSDMLRGLPLGQSSASVYQAPPSMASQVAGAGLGLYGASKLFKKGGKVKKGSGLADIQLHRLVGKA